MAMEQFGKSRSRMNEIERSELSPLARSNRRAYTQGWNYGFATSHPWIGEAYYSHIGWLVDNETGETPLEVPNHAH